MGRRKSDAGGKQHFRLLYEIMDMDRWHSLSGNALKVYFWIVRQYSGFNNGKLTASYSAIRERDGLARPTIQRALAELEEKGFIYRTSQGALNGRASCYAVMIPRWKVDYPRGDGGIKPAKSLSDTYQRSID